MTNELPPVMRTAFTDPSTGLTAFIVADTLVDRRAMGGTRIWPNVTADEVAALARKMTLKLALADLPIGGAKAGIVCNLPLGPERDRRLRSFGRLAAPLLHGGIYLGSDMGCSYRDRDLFFDAAHYTVQPKERRGPRAGHSIPCTWPELWQRCADITGHGTAHAGLAVADAQELPRSRRTAVIQGFGVVGRGVARLLDEHGYKVLAVADVRGTVICNDGLPVEELRQITDATGIIDRERLPTGCIATDARDAWLDVDAGMLVLAAGTDALHKDNVARVKADLVVEGANLPTSLEARGVLVARRVNVVPDILANIGGAMVTALVLSGQTPTDLPTDELVAWIFDEVARRVRRNVVDVQTRSRLDGTSPYVTCDVMAVERAAPRYERPTKTTMPPPLR